MATVDGLLPEKGLAKGTNWWGAFVIGLAGTILVTGIAPYVVQGTGALGIILMGVMTIIGCFLCFCLAELATMWPDRTGGIPSFATESFRPLVGDTAARHIGGVSGWAYWLGWFPVAPINVILTASYLAVLFGFSPGHTIDPVGTTWGTPIGITIIVICFALLVAIFIPAYLGIRLGAAFATVLGVLSMLPITVMIFLPFFKPSSIHWGNVAASTPRRESTSARSSSPHGSSRSCGT
jgi:amino acid transporter